MFGERAPFETEEVVDNRARFNGQPETSNRNMLCAWQPGTALIRQISGK